MNEQMNHGTGEKLRLDKKSGGSNSSGTRLWPRFAWLLGVTEGFRAERGLLKIKEGSTGRVQTLPTPLRLSRGAADYLEMVFFDWFWAPWSNSRVGIGHVGRMLQRLVRYGEKGSTRIMTANKPFPEALGDDELNDGMTAF